jgi:hypothetical protein
MSPEATSSRADTARSVSEDMVVFVGSQTQGKACNQHPLGNSLAATGGHNGGPGSMAAFR